MTTRRPVAITGLICLACLGSPAAGQSIRYVDDDAPPSGNGQTWAAAYDDLQDALAEASTNGVISRIRVAGGTYRPDCMPDPCVGTNGNREATFQLLSGVTIAGGYRGLAGGGDPDDRDIEVFESTLSGDLGTDDIPDLVAGLACFSGDGIPFELGCDSFDGDGDGDVDAQDLGIEENSYHVVTGSFTDATAVLDGFTISGGYASGGGGHSNGGGLWNDYGSPTVANCILMGNSTAGGRGGGMNSRGGTPTVSHCTFTGNLADGPDGGAIYNHDTGLTVINCTFTENSVRGGDGGAIYSCHSELTVTNCTFTGNSARGGDGGGMSNRDSGLTVINCTFTGNSADGGDGGGMSNRDSDLTVSNCTFTGNSAGQIGGGMYSRGGHSTLVNCVLWHDTAVDGLELALTSFASPTTVTVSYSDVQGGEAAAYVGDGCTLNWSEGNIDADPLFVDADGPDGIPGTPDDDLHLSPGSPCIDAGDNTAVPIEVTTDLDGSPRFVDDPATPDTGQGTPPIVDMGAYEYQAAVVAPLDIKPGSCPNPFNRNSHGVLPVVLVGTDAFDVMEIDVSSVLLSRADGVGGELAPNEGPPGPHSEFEDVATPFEGEPCDCHDLESDGIVDLSMKVRSDDVVEVLELDDLDSGALVELVVRGSLLDGTPFQASDCIRLVPPGTSPGLLTVESNVAGAWIDVSPLDDTLDGGGFADFERSFPQSTVVTLTAETPIHGRSFRAWQIDGVLQTTGQTVAEVTIVEGLTARAVYRPRPLKDPGLGEHDSRPAPLNR